MPQSLMVCSRCPNIHNYQAISSSIGKIFKPSYRTDWYGKIQSILVPLIVAIKISIILVYTLLLETNSSTEIKSLLNDKYL